MAKGSGGGGGASGGPETMQRLRVIAGQKPGMRAFVEGLGGAAGKATPPGAAVVSGLGGPGPQAPDPHAQFRPFLTEGDRRAFAGLVAELAAARLREGLPPPVPSVPMPAAFGSIVGQAARDGAFEGAVAGWRQAAAAGAALGGKAGRSRTRAAALFALGIAAGAFGLGFACGLCAPLLARWMGV